MIFQRFYTPGLAIYSYLIGDEDIKRCVVIDPTRHVTPYIIEAQNAGYDITAILETHVHADFVSGSKELKHQLNDKPLIYASGMGGSSWLPCYVDYPVQAGTQLKIGRIRLEAIHTPGHTPEHIIWIGYDERRSVDTPWVVFTGDCLFVGGVGRPDLLGPNESIPLAKQLYQTLFETLSFIPDFVEIYPSHGYGTFCGKALSGINTSTMGYERRFNPQLQKKREDQWVEDLFKGLPEAPPYFEKVKKINVSGPPLLKSLKTGKWGEEETNLSFKQLFLLDIRHPEVFADSHLSSSLNIHFSHIFCQSAGWMLPDQCSIGLVMENSHVASDVIDQLRLMGFDQDIWTIAFEKKLPNIPSVYESFPMIDAEELAKTLETNQLKVLDVRTVDEWNSGHIPRATHIELNMLERSLHQLVKNQSFVLVCRSGVRASLAASLLKKHGFKSVLNLRGGMQAWQQSNLPIET